MSVRVRRFSLKEIEEIATFLIENGPPEGESPDSYFAHLLFEGYPPEERPGSWPREAWDQWNNFKSVYFKSFREGERRLSGKDLWDAILASQASEAPRRMTWGDIARRLVSTERFVTVRAKTKGFRIENRKLVGVSCIKCELRWEYRPGDRYYCDLCKGEKE